MGTEGEGVAMTRWRRPSYRWLPGVAVAWAVAGVAIALLDRLLWEKLWVVVDLFVLFPWRGAGAGLLVVAARAGWRNR